LQPKRNKGDISNKSHIVKEGETLRSISQTYAIKLDKLAKHNLLAINSELKPGDQILLRGRKKGKAVTNDRLKLEIKDNETKEEFKVNFDSDK